jgi:hypothetical protein
MVAVAGHLSTEELGRRYRAARDWVAHGHLQAVWLLAQGRSRGEVARIIGLSGVWVAEIVHRYDAGAAEGLGDRRRGNADARPLLGAEDEAAPRAVLAAPPADGGLWTGPEMAAWMAARLGRTERHRAFLARPEAPPPRPSDLPRCRPARPRCPQGRPIPQGNANAKRARPCPELLSTTLPCPRLGACSAIAWLGGLLAQKAHVCWGWEQTWRSSVSQPGVEPLRQRSHLQTDSAEEVDERTSAPPVSGVGPLRHLNGNKSPVVPFGTNGRCTR